MARELDPKHYGEYQDGMKLYRVFNSGLAYQGREYQAVGFDPSEAFGNVNAGLFGTRQPKETGNWEVLEVTEA